MSIFDTTADKDRLEHATEYEATANDGAGSR